MKTAGSVLNAKILAAIGVVAAVIVAGLLYTMLAPVDAVPAPPETIGKLQPLDKPQIVPTVAFNDASGARHALTEFRGHYVLLNLWATWCAPCVRELPALAGLQAAVPGGLKVVAVDVGRGSASDAAQFLKAHHAGALPVYVDSDIALIRAFGAFGLPYSILIDPQGREVARAVGPGAWDAPDAVEYFKTLTRKSGAS
jgi:thiol-disulfide isomerase/thioredoxin